MRKTRRLVLALFVAVMMLFGLVPVVASAVDDDVHSVRVGYYENEVFQEGAREGAVRTGYAYEYYRKLSEYTGWTYEYVYGDYSELYQKLLDGDIDLLAGLAFREDRVGLVGYPKVPMGNESYNLVKHDYDDAITAEPATLSGKRIGVLESAVETKLRAYLEECDIKAEVVTFGGYDALFDAFDTGEVDVMAAEGDGARGRNHAEILCEFGSADYYLCVSMKRPDLLDELNTAQTNLATNEPNYISSLRARYYSASLSSRALSSAEKAWVADHDTLRVGYLNNYIPYSGTDEQGNVTGVIRDLLPYMLTSMNLADIKLEYKGYDSYDDMVAGMQEGAIDVAFPVGGGLYYSEENGINQSNPVVSSSTGLVYLGEFDEHTTERFAINENNRMQYYFVQTHYPDAQIVLYPSIDACLEAVLNGEVGCTTLNGLRANDILRNRDYRDLSLRQLAQADDRCFGVRIGDEGLLLLLNRGINVVGADYAQNLAYRYTSDLYTYSVMDVLEDYAAIIVVLILCVAALIIFFLARDSKRAKQQVDEKEQARRELEKKSEELASSKEALSEALEDAERANHAKTDFLNNMSHDIRTPMNAIVGFTALATSHIDDTEQVRDYLAKIEVSSQHLLSLINDVLDMSRIESGQLTIAESQVHLPDVIRDLRTIIQPDVAAKRQDLFMDTQGVINEDVVTDRLRLNQVLLNVLSNAIKFTPEGGSVGLRLIQRSSAKKDVANLEFRISDTGVGMSQELLSHVFEPFVREKTSTESGVSGTGLGLALTKNIVDLMGGSIQLTSVEGEGTECVICLPCRVSDAPVVEQRLAQLEGRRALVVDDDTNVCQSVCAMLGDLGMHSEWTMRGSEALEIARAAKAERSPFSVFVVDWMMPDLDGIRTVRGIRDIVGDEPPIIMLSAYDWSDVRKEAQEAGVTAFCSKPLFMSQLRDTLARTFVAEVDEGDGCHGTDEAVNRNSSAAGGPSGGTASATDFSGKRALLVEDGKVNQEIGTMILRQAGFEVDVAENGLVAVQKMEDSPAGTYDIVLMDIQMPVMDGYEATRRIRALDDAKKARIPIVAVTANAVEEEGNSAESVGMDGQLFKPYDIPQMMATIASLV